MSNYKQIIQESWHITKEYKEKLFKYGFWPSLFISILGIIWIAYQIISFKNSDLVPGSFSFGIQDIATFLWGWIKMHGIVSFSIGLFLIFSFFMYTILPPICESAIIHYNRQIKNGKKLEELKGGLGAGLGNFYKMFELSVAMAPFHIFTIISSGGFFARNFGEQFIGFFLPFLVFIFIIGLIVNFLLVFSGQFIVIEGKSVLQAMSASAGMVLGNIKDIIFLWWILGIVIFRILINIFILFLIPLIIFLILSFFATTNFFSIGILIGGIVSIFLIWVSSYLLGGFSVFMNTFWTVSYFKFKENEGHEDDDKNDYKKDDDKKNEDKKN